MPWTSTCWAGSPPPPAGAETVEEVDAEAWLQEMADRAKGGRLLLALSVIVAHAKACGGYSRVRQ